jgi:hypothetical protein
VHILYCREGCEQSGLADPISDAVSAMESSRSTTAGRRGESAPSRSGAGTSFLLVPFAAVNVWLWPTPSSTTALSLVSTPNGISRMSSVDSSVVSPCRACPSSSRPVGPRTIPESRAANKPEPDGGVPSATLNSSAFRGRALIQANVHHRGWLCHYPPCKGRRKNKFTFAVLRVMREWCSSIRAVLRVA